MSNKSRITTPLHKCETQVLVFHAPLVAVVGEGHEICATFHGDGPLALGREESLYTKPQLNTCSSYQRSDDLKLTTLDQSQNSTSPRGIHNNNSSNDKQTLDGEWSP
ncbi:hypothetical protein BsWGS_26077 [Bradybaena similaris]